MMRMPIYLSRLFRLARMVALGIAALLALQAAALTLTAVKSRKIHGATGLGELAIDASKPLASASITVEPRTIGTGHQIVFVFDGTVTTTGTAAAMDAFGAVGNVAASITGALNTPINNEVTVLLTAIPDN